MDYTINHIFREQNQITDFFANLGERQELNYLHIDDLPKNARGMIRLDRLSLPNWQF